MSSYQWPPQGSGGGGSGVSSLNSLTGDLSLLAGAGISITPSGSSLTIANTGGAGANTFLSNLTSPTALNQDLIFNEGTNAQILTANSSSGPTANLNMKTGDGTGQASGSFSIGAGNSDTENGGVVEFSGGNVTTATANQSSGGAVSIFGGNTSSTNVNSQGGVVYIVGGNAPIPGNSGSVSLYDGNGDAGINVGPNVGVNILDDAGIQGAQFFSTNRELDNSTGSPTLQFTNDLVLLVTAPNLIQFQDGSQGTAGYVWTSIDAGGSGHWLPNSSALPSPLEALATFTDSTFGLPGTFLGNNSDLDQTNQVIYVGSTDTAINANSTSYLLLVTGSLTGSAPTGSVGPIAIAAGSTFGSTSIPGGGVYINSGSSANSNGGDIDITSGEGNVVSSGNINIETGTLYSGGTSGGNTGNVVLVSGDVQAGDGNSGTVQINSGLAGGNGNTGNVSIATGPAEGTGISGNMSFQSGATVSATSGTSTLTTGVSTSGSSGATSLLTGNTSGSNPSGNINIISGSGTSGASGNVSLFSGGSTGSSSGDVLINSGNGVTSGPIQIVTGTASGGNSGPILLLTGTASGSRGLIQLRNGSEGTAGQVWTSTDTGGSGSWAPATVGVSVTITTAALTTLGTQGSMTFVNGILTSQTQAT